MSETENTEQKTVKDDGLLAASILIVALVVIASTIYFLWKNKKLLGISDSGWKTSSFTPPPERENYIAAKAKLDMSNPNHVEELKKLLMRRAIQAIPILLNLQNEGNSIERLYKRGMLTDDMHFKVKELKSFVDQEFQEVQVEAEDLVEGWGQNIWPQAMQFHQLIQRQAEEKVDDKGENKDKSAGDKKETKPKKTASKPAAATTSSAETSTDSTPVEKDKAVEAEKIAKELLKEEEKTKNTKKKASKK